MNDQDPKLRTKINSEQNISNKEEFPSELRQEKVNHFSASIDNSNQEFSRNFIVPLNGKDNQIKNVQDFFSQYGEIKNLLQFNLDKIEKHNERNGEKLEIYDNLGKISGKILIKTPRNHEIQLFLQQFSSTNYCKLYKINIYRLLEKINRNIISLKEELIRFFILKDFPEPFIILFPLDELEYFSQEEIVLLYSIFKITDNFAPISLGGLFLFVSSLKQNLPHEFNNFFDLEVNVKIPDIQSKKRLIESILKNIPNNNVDIDHFSLQVKDWNVASIRKFIIFAYRYFQINQKDDLTSKMKFNTKFLSDLIENNSINFRNDISLDKKNAIQINNTINSQPKLLDSGKKLNQNLENQLYQESASKNYEDLCIILDKIQKGIVLLPFERQTLADNSFILKEDPQKALQKLNKAKSTVDKFKKIIS
ncbi:hypothetical protein DSAG12_00496 [Promethearchaeum syntrophicum]|uniref:Uncharacterized protein n=1 Tax=Promethearchaeum syntrophicum TaxID=2594042 RepID=A0A5B9D6T5_9ARCH|nr:hypothetical protein [Candidatus Prometheoarchaeum syntrophicum]QEE14683.1 hypothetical protein DSAG12_00496 [Candidatus Prometheoarchaeum syntrophicum]